MDGKPMRWPLAQPFVAWLFLIFPQALPAEEQEESPAPVVLSRHSIIELNQAFGQLEKERAEFEIALERFRTVELLDHYLAETKERLDQIEGYWTVTFYQGDRPGVTRRAFIVRIDKDRFVKGFILDNDIVKFYMHSDIQIEKNDETYIVVPSTFSKSFGWVDRYSSFKIKGNHFHFTSDTRHWDMETGCVRRHEFNRLDSRSTR